MKNRFYLLMTVLFVLLTFNLSESRVIGQSAGASIGPHSWSVTIPVRNAPSIYQRMAERGDALFQPSTTRGKISDNESPRPQDRVKMPQKDTTQTPGTRKAGTREQEFLK